MVMVKSIVKKRFCAAEGADVRYSKHDGEKTRGGGANC